MSGALSGLDLRDCSITPAGPWRHLEVLDAVDSTNAFSVRSPRPWQVVAAAEQTAGRGRRERAWISPQGTSVSISLTVPMTPDPADWGWLPLMTGLSTRDALEEVTGSAEFTLKWPNDVLARDIEGRWGKICGILCETVPPELVVAGVGINVSVPREALPLPTATSLLLCGHLGVRREALAASLSRAFARYHARWYAGGDGLEQVRAAYRGHCSTLGAEVAIQISETEVVAGNARDVDDSGEIVIQTTAGTRSFAAGDVVHLRPGPRPSRTDGTGVVATRNEPGGAWPVR